MLTVCLYCVIKAHMSRKNISLSDKIEDRAKKLIAKRGFDGLSDMIAVLVREEFERRGLDEPVDILEMKDAPLSSAPPNTAHTAPAASHTSEADKAGIPKIFSVVPKPARTSRISRTKSTRASGVKTS